MAAYSSFDDILLLLKSRNSVWSFDDEASNKIIIFDAMLSVINLETTIDKTCSLTIKNAMVELPIDLYRIENVSLPYKQQGTMLIFQQPNGKVDINYKGVVLENGLPSVPENAVDFVIAKVEFYKARNEWLANNLNENKFRFYENEVVRTRRKAVSVRMTKQQAHEMIFMQRWGGLFNSYL